MIAFVNLIVVLVTHNMETKSIYSKAIHCKLSVRSWLLKQTTFIASTMKFTLALLGFGAALALTAAAPDLESCKCWNGFEARQDDNGKVMCYGKVLFALKPCNLPQAPLCKCEKEKVTGILTDKDGTFCSISDKGQMVKKWPCENEDEWKEYKVQYEEYEKTREH